MLLETLFCVGFFLTPLLGMFAMVIYGAVKASLKLEAGEPASVREMSEAEGAADSLESRLVKDKVRKYAIPQFENPIRQFQNQKIVTYQLLESRGHKRLTRNRFKKGAHQRAGP